ncbi:pantoate--beta-alanine ligase [compost metagenome]
MTAERLVDQVKVHIRTADEAVIDYVELLSYPSLQAPDAAEALERLEQPFILALAVKFGTTRLIDNCLLEIAGGV